MNAVKARWDPTRLLECMPVHLRVHSPEGVHTSSREIFEEREFFRILLLAFDEDTVRLGGVVEVPHDHDGHVVPASERELVQESKVQFTHRLRLVLGVGRGVYGDHPDVFLTGAAKSDSCEAARLAGVGIAVGNACVPENSGA